MDFFKQYSQLESQDAALVYFFKSPFLVYELLWRFRLRSRGISPSKRLVDLGELAVISVFSRITEVRLARPLGVPSEEAFDRGDNNLVLRAFDWSKSSDFSSVD